MYLNKTQGFRVESRFHVAVLGMVGGLHVIMAFSISVTSVSSVYISQVMTFRLYQFTSEIWDMELDNCISATVSVNASTIPFLYPYQVGGIQ